MRQWEHSAILSTFIKLPFVIKIFVLSSFEWPLKTGFTVFVFLQVFGLCGDFDGNQRNDFTTPQGGPTAIPTNFADSWKVGYTCRMFKPYKPNVFLV